jgi:glycosyltransferase involved in cell wall biosynthesis
MLNARRVFVIVPALDEARLIERTLNGVPAFVDAVIVVDDASTDGTAERARLHSDPRVTVLEQAKNRGVGAAIARGYARALERGADVLCVMAGDNQMHPDDLGALAEPVATGRFDYVKGNRFLHREAHRMPWPRRAAGRMLAAATRVATGLAVDDTQCGYTALAAEAAQELPLAELWSRFGYPNDLLGMLAARGLRVGEVPVRPVYADERSGVRPWHALVVLGVVFRRFWLERGSGVLTFTRAERGRRSRRRTAAHARDRSTRRVRKPRAAS